MAQAVTNLSMLRQACVFCMHTYTRCIQVCSNADVRRDCQQDTTLCTGLCDGPGATSSKTCMNQSQDSPLRMHSVSESDCTKADTHHPACGPHAAASRAYLLHSPVGQDWYVIFRLLSSNTPVLSSPPCTNRKSAGCTEEPCHERLLLTPVCRQSMRPGCTHVHCTTWL